ALEAEDVVVMVGKEASWPEEVEVSIDSNDGRGGGGFVVQGGRSFMESKNACEKVGGVDKMRLTRSKLMVRGEECVKGCVKCSRRTGNDGSVPTLESVLKAEGIEHYTNLVIMSKNVEMIENVIENESHFILQIVDNDLDALAMFAKHFMSRGEVSEGGDDFGVSKSFLGYIPKVVIGECGGETFEDDGGAIC
nr:hypothetical protein [Tanacetum cinerariifolium]